MRHYDTFGSSSAGRTSRSFAAADMALYKAKDAGRDRVRVYAHASGNAKTAQAAEEGDEASDGYP